MDVDGILSERWTLISQLAEAGVARMKMKSPY